MIVSSKSETLLYTEKKQMQRKPEEGRRENNLAKKDKRFDRPLLYAGSMLYASNACLKARGGSRRQPP
jgi:hypothetical protein